MVSLSVREERARENSSLCLDAVWRTGKDSCSQAGDQIIAVGTGKQKSRICRRGQSYSSLAGARDRLQLVSLQAGSLLGAPIHQL